MPVGGRDAGEGSLERTLVSLSPRALAARAGHFDPAFVRTAHARGALRALGAVARFPRGALAAADLPSLAEADLAENGLGPDLAAAGLLLQEGGVGETGGSAAGPLLPAPVRELSLAANRFSSLEGARDAPLLRAVETLRLEGNLLPDVQALAPLAALPHLTRLWLRDGRLSNPLCADKHHRAQVFRVLPNLISLDGRPRVRRDAAEGEGGGGGGGGGEEGDAESTLYSDSGSESEREETDESESHFAAESPGSDSDVDDTVSSSSSSSSSRRRRRHRLRCLRPPRPWMLREPPPLPDQIVLDEDGSFVRAVESLSQRVDAAHRALEAARARIPFPQQQRWSEDSSAEKEKEAAADAGMMAAELGSS